MVGFFGSFDGFRVRVGEVVEDGDGGEGGGGVL